MKGQNAQNPKLLKIANRQHDPYDQERQNGWIDETAIIAKIANLAEMAKMADRQNGNFGQNGQNGRNEQNG